MSPISVEAWLKPEATGTDQVVLAHYECGGVCSSDVPSPSSYILRVTEDGVARWGIRDADAPLGNDGDAVTGSTDLTDGEWHHVVAVMDPSGPALSLYVDGQLDHVAETMQDNDGSGFAEDGDSETDPVTIGFSIQSITGAYINAYTGLIDELSVYDDALSTGEIASLYGAGIAGKCE